MTTASAQAESATSDPATTGSGDPAPIPSRTLPLLLWLLAAGVVLLLFAFYTVHRRNPDQLPLNGAAARTQFAIAYWLDHGYLRSGGLAVRQSGEGVALHRSQTGGRLLSTLLLQRVYVTITGRYGWRLTAFHNQLVAMITSALLGLLGFRLARRLAAPPLHALVLALALQAVHFTFPGNLALYWELQPRGPWLLFAVLFLVIEERALVARTRRLERAQAASAFLLTYMDPLSGVAFVASYLLVKLVLGTDGPGIRRMAALSAGPAALALAAFAAQLLWARMMLPDLPRQGSDFMFRTGLDGSLQYYRSHLDIAFGRDVARANFPPAGKGIFDWTWMFLGGAAAVLGVLLAALSGRVPRIAVGSLVTLLGPYLLLAAMFSQSVVVHPYLYDVMLFTPLALALFVIAPAAGESMARHRGILVLTAVFLAAWVSMVQLREYAVWYPPDPAAITGLPSPR